MKLEYVWREMDFWKLLTLLVAVFATYVAYRQYALGRERFKLDLFEKRFAVFAATRRFPLMSFMTQTSPSTSSSSIELALLRLSSCSTTTSQIT
ncbi:MAG: hypothetical protein HY525_10725 [Betaproteobacteria bacterium]|nr:hypothetical protein [Betaproteobacteria bacterium]